MKQRNMTGQDFVICGNGTRVVKAFEVVDCNVLLPGFEKVGDDTSVGRATTTDQKGDSSAAKNHDESAGVATMGRAFKGAK